MTQAWSTWSLWLLSNGCRTPVLPPDVQAIADLKRQLAGAQADAFRLQQQHKQQLLAAKQQQMQYEESLSLLQISNVSDSVC